MKTNQEQNKQMREVYQKPQVEIIEMETDGNYLLSTSGEDFTGGGGYPWS